MNDIYRPLYHFTPPSGWMNDPNGLIFFDDEWHLFYQHIPEGEKRQHWGHAVSRDLVHWEHLPIALPPDDLGAIWSGSCVADEHDTSGLFDGGRGLVAVFTHQDDKRGQRQSLAYSRDKGRTWTKFEDNPVLSGDNPNFRDPKVFWHGPTARWVMVLATGDCATFYTSPDLRTWTHASSFRAPGLPDGLVWECPDLFEMIVENDPDNTRWVLHASFLLGDSAGEGLGRCVLRHFIGTFDGTTFWPDEDIATPTNFGPDDYAAITWADAPNGRHILLGWMSHWAYAGKVPTSGWKGLMTLPRELTLRANENGTLRLMQTPAPELRALRRQDARTWTGETMRSQSRQLIEQTGDAFEIEAEIRLGAARETGLRLRAGEGHHTTVGYDTQTQTLFVDRTRSGETCFHPHFAGRYQAPLTLSADGILRLRLFADRCSLEVFTADGIALLGTLLFPDPHNQALEFYAEGGDATLTTLTLHPLAATVAPVSGA